MIEVTSNDDHAKRHEREQQHRYDTSGLRKHKEVKVTSPNDNSVYKLDLSNIKNGNPQRIQLNMTVD